MKLGDEEVRDTVKRPPIIAPIGAHVIVVDVIRHWHFGSCATLESTFITYLVGVLVVTLASNVRLTRLSGTGMV